MKRFLVNVYLTFIYLLNLSLPSHSYPINIGPHSIHKFGNYNNGNVCLLNYNNVYSTFYKWSKDKEEYHDKIIRANSNGERLRLKRNTAPPQTSYNLDKLMSRSEE
jgi:hypothetical protein